MPFSKLLQHQLVLLELCHTSVCSCSPRHKTESALNWAKLKGFAASARTKGISSFPVSSIQVFQSLLKRCSRDNLKVGVPKPFAAKLYLPRAALSLTLSEEQAHEDAMFFPGASAWRAASGCWPQGRLDPGQSLSGAMQHCGAH